MPPKAKPKKDEKKMQKVIEDKTFGLKNKKGAKMQKYIAQLQNQVITFWIFSSCFDFLFRF